MPVVLSINGYRFKFYSNENDEPPHIHVMKAEGNTKYWLTLDVLEEYSYGYKSTSVAGVPTRHRASATQVIDYQ